MVICPNCGLQMVLRTGKYGKFWGCSGFPKCRQTVTEYAADRKRKAQEKVPAHLTQKRRIEQRNGFVGKTLQARVSPVDGFYDGDAPPWND